MSLAESFTFANETLSKTHSLRRAEREVKLMEWHWSPFMIPLGAFVVAETDQPTAIVYLDRALDGQVVESAEVAETIDVVFRALQMEALTGNASLNKMKEAAQGWKEQITP